MYKLSPYIYQTENTNGELVLADLYGSRMYKVCKEKKEKFKACINNPNLQSELQKYFIDREVFWSRKKYESDYKKEIYENYINLNETLELIILPTEKCNFRCSYCYEEYEKGVMSKEIQQGIVNYVRKNLKQYRRLIVNWFGGEPLCAIDVINDLTKELRAICKEYKKPYTAVMTTNGYYLDLENFKMMYKKNLISSYQITIDGVKEIHDHQRKLASGMGTFDVIMKNLIDIKENINTNLLKISIRTNITKDILARFDEYVDLITHQFGDDGRFEFIWRIAWSPEGKVDDKVYCKKLDLIKVLEKYKDRKLNFDTDLFQFSCYGNICYAADKNSFVIGSDGTIYKCTTLFTNEQNKVGKLSEDGEMHLDMQKFKFWVEPKACMDMNKCGECFDYPTCLGIYCPAKNMNKNGEFVCMHNEDITAQLNAYIEYYSKQKEIVEDVSDLL